MSLEKYYRAWFESDDPGWFQFPTRQQADELSANKIFFAKTPKGRREEIIHWANFIDLSAKTNGHLTQLTESAEENKVQELKKVEGIKPIALVSFTYCSFKSINDLNK